MRSDAKALKRMSGKLYREGRKIDPDATAEPYRYGLERGLREAALMCAREARKIEKERKR